MSDYLIKDYDEKNASEKTSNYETENQLHEKNVLLNAKQDINVKPQPVTTKDSSCCNVFYAEMKYDNPIIDFIYNNKIDDTDLNIDLLQLFNYNADVLG